MRARIRTTDLEGTVVEAEGVFAGWADQVAFERRFGVNAAILSRLGDSFDEDGGLRKDADATAIRSEWLAFLAWRLLSRGPARGVDFETWIETIADLDLSVDEDATAVPTTATATPLPSS